MEKTRILIVEDEAIIAMEVESQLQSLGYEVTSIVDTGEKALKKAEEEKPDLILMDIRIKGEMDGIDTAEMIRKNFGIPVIFSTAYLDGERIERAKITMPFGYVLKPIQERDLKVTIEMALYVVKVDSERKKVEKELAESEIKFRNIFDNAQVGIYRSRLIDGKMLLANDRMAEIFGFKDAEECIVKYVAHDQYVYPEMRKELVEMLQITGKISGFETPLFRKDGKIIWVQFFGILLPDKENFEGIAVDISARKQAEEALNESRFLFSQMFEQTTTSTQLFNPDGYCIDVNSAFCKLYGVNGNDMADRKYNIFEDKNLMSDRVSALVKEIFNERKTNIWEGIYDIAVSSDLTGIATAKSEPLHLEVFGYPILDRGDQLKYVVFQTYDITKRKQAEQERNKSENHLKEIVNSISHPFHVIDVKTRIIKHASKAIGQDVIGKTCYSATHNSPIPCSTAEHPCPIEIILKTKKPTVTEHTHFQSDGTKRLIEIHASPLFDENGEVEYIIESNIDITEKSKT